jgi:anti-sigma regulatory factor (Ser/Thr protein kinase)
MEPSLPERPRPGDVFSRLWLAPLPTAPLLARRQTRLVLRSWRIGPDVISTAELLVSELVTNAVKFADAPGVEPGASYVIDPRGTFLTLRYLADQITIEVSDPNSCPPAAAEADEEAESGRGLMLVQALSKEWGYYLPPAGGKIVYCVLADLARS